MAMPDDEPPPPPALERIEVILLILAGWFLVGSWIFGR
jgi:hypothetical protein